MILRGKQSYADEWFVRGASWKLKFKRRINRANDYGECDPSEKTITIKQGVRRGEMFKTLVHELLHAIEFEYGVEVPHRFIEVLEIAVYNLLIENFQQFLDLWDDDARRKNKKRNHRLPKGQ